MPGPHKLETLSHLFMEIIWQWSSLHQHDYIPLGEVSGTVLGAKDTKRTKTWSCS